MANIERALWIGGTSGAGKSTAARLLARRHGLRCYSSDTATWRHRERAVADGDASARAWERLTAQQRTDLPASEQVALDLDRSRYVLDDVGALPDEPAVVAEGTTIVPSALPSGAVALWLTARPDVRAARTAVRGWGDAGGEADLLRSAILREQLLGTDTVVIDTTDHAEPGETVLAIEGAVRPWLSSSPGATDPAARRRLRRDLNRALVGQHRAGWRHHGRSPDPRVVRPLECECSDPDCAEFVETVVAAPPEPFDLTSPALLAAGHR